MKKNYLCSLVLAVLASVQVNSQEVLKHLASFSSKGDGSAETVAYDSATQKAFITNSNVNSFTIVNLADPAKPTKILDVALSSYGAGPNSIATYGDFVAIAVENAVKQENGKVVFFSTGGTFLKEFTVGALPDMITFTPDGKKLLVANEGEPNKDYTNDPEGTVSVIDISNGLTSATVTSIDFTSYNGRKASLQNKGVRIFGKNATVAQDLEPEYITVTKDGKYAYVNCQENNALAVIDLSNNSIKDILPLGYKDHSNGTYTVQPYVINELVSDWPTLGTPVYNGGQDPVKLGGFSGLWYDKSSTLPKMSFYAVPDRGPNDSPVKKAKVTPATTQNLRPFKLPNYQARIAKFTLDVTTGKTTLDKQIMLTRKDGTTPISGRGNIPGVDEVPVTYADAATAYKNEDYTSNDVKYHALPYDEFGGDFEGVLIDKNNNFWLCDEYRPALYKFDATGKLIERYVAKGTSKLGTTPKPEGTYGAETLPAVYAKRRANRGFEGIAYDAQNDIIYAFIQSPMYNPDSSTKNKSDVIRILGVRASDGVPVSEYVYALERNRDAGFAFSRVDKIGDAFYTGGGRFYVIERDSSKPEDKGGKKYVFAISITGATNVLGKTYARELEQMSIDEMVTDGIKPVSKNKVLNLPSIGYQSSDKAEGLVFLPTGQIAVLNDNDFGLAGAGITDKSVLGIISTKGDYGFDASNKDGKINIKSHQVLGMYQPDAIATYNVDGMDYIVTANEGDSRNYDGYSEETRVKKLKLNPIAYPDASELQKEENLGRLKTTTANGDYDGDGVIDQIYSYGARSFSIFDKYGNLVYDSADIFGRKTAEEEPTLFNRDDEKKDGRSDDKGVEPEAVAIGTIGGVTYAFIGLERQSSILMFDITDPKNVKFVTYYKGHLTSGDIAPEIIKFVPSDKSPNGKNLLLVGYEVSGTMAVIEIDGASLSSTSEELSDVSFIAYPVPTKNTLNFNKEVDAVIYSLRGQLVKRVQGKSVDVSDLAEGVYIVKTKNYGTRRFLKM